MALPLGACRPMSTSPLASCSALATAAESLRVSNPAGGGAPSATGSVGYGFRMMRSTTASRVWFLRFSSRIPSSTSVISPSMRMPVALLVERLNLLAKLALASAHDRRHHRDALARGVGPAALHNLRHDLLGRLPRDGPVAVRTVRLANRRIQQPQVVVDLGDRADGRTRGAGGRLLLNRDRGRQPIDGVDVGPLHLVEKLPRVGRQRLDVAPLSLGVDRVERQRALARPGKSGDDGQGIARNRDGNVLQIVLTSPANVDVREVLGRRLGRRGQVSSLLGSATAPTQAAPPASAGNAGWVI